ncbi:LicD family protein [Lentilactobacillus parafarraginis]|uniref:LICD family protein n=1 Tax=Lentilactobacillus parafarraginis DSM 18390 = JCM 14109 TaxID=1423786 RepID=A0A0R1YFJ3_9LACO|nr:LicD family protein [Lentilactobacillus parafarraginis]KRM41085.1 LICD family protein [Lentilactobacillus parafarraginis DSM 18390 = JCM 14109]
MADNLITIIHQVELNIFKKFALVAEKYHLHYMASGGTLLGAIRHQGFIPWDDDMDIAMPRADYEQFLKVAPAAFEHDHFFLQTPWSDINYALSYAKILDRNTFIEERNNVNDARKGVFLDVFPLDRIPESPSKQRRQLVDMRRLDSRIYLKLRYNIIDNPIRKFHNELTEEQQETALEFKQHRQAIMTAYNDNPDLKQVKNLASQYAYEKEIYTQDQLASMITVPFEDTSIRVPTDYNAILTQIYGDYMALPPDNQRSEKHIAKLFYNNQLFEI